MSLKRVLLFSLGILVLSGLVGCRETEITVKSGFGRLRPEQLVLSLQAYGKFRCAYGYQKKLVSLSRLFLMPDLEAF